MASSKIIHCAFCGRDQAEVTRLISGPSAYICDGCIALCQQILQDYSPSADNNAPIRCSQAEIRDSNLTVGWLMQQADAPNNDARLEAFLELSVSDLNDFMHAQIRRALDERLPEEIATLEAEMSRQRDVLNTLTEQKQAAQQTLDVTAEKLKNKQQRLASLAKGK